MIDKEREWVDWMNTGVLQMGRVLSEALKQYYEENL